jgi:putative DNA methylase
MTLSIESEFRRKAAIAGRDARALSMEEPKGWHSRGYLPHFDGGAISQFVTVHLGDALPQKVIDRWKLELEHEKDEDAKKEIFWRVEKYLDKGIGKCYLKDRRIAELVQNSLLHFDGEHHRLISWVIMPNHIHVLLKPREGHELSAIMHSIKSYSASKANKLLGRKGRFWQMDYFDRFIRNHEHFENTVNYIEMNPVKAGLCKRPEDWEFGSARRRS